MGPKKLIKDTDKAVHTILEERGDVYGDYRRGLIFRLELMDLISGRYEEVNGTAIDDEELMLFNDVISKLGRLAVSPKHLDSWKDLAGYALLIEEVIKHESK